MAEVTIRIPDELKKKIDEHPEINWLEVFRKMVIRKVEQLKKFEELVERGEI